MKKATISAIIIAVLAIVAAITGATININIEQDKYNATIEYSEEQQPAIVEDDMGELKEEEAIPTVEEVDGGLFADEKTGVSSITGEYEDLGAYVETFDTSTPIAFRNATIGKCVIANNRYGAQCVSLARVFWWSYADRDVSTCGTGMAKGMMNCADENAGDDFEIYWRDSIDKIQAEYIAEIKLRNINKEYILKQTRAIDDLEREIDDLKDTLNSGRKLKNVIIKELQEVAKKYGKPRKTEIVYQTAQIEEEDEAEEIPDYPVTIFVSNEKY